MTQMNSAFIFSQLWLMIATQNTNEHDQKGLAIIPEINFPPVRLKTPPPLAQHSHQEHREQRLLKNQIRRFQHYQQREGKRLDKHSGVTNGTITEPLIKLPVVRFVQVYASNDTQLAVSPLNSSVLQKTAFSTLPSNEEQRNRKMLLNNTRAPEENKNGTNKKDEGDSGFNDNAIVVEVEMRRKMERTTVQVRNYPPITEVTPPSVTANRVSIDSKLVPSLTMPASPSPFTTNYQRSNDLDSRARTTVSYANLSASMPSNQHDTWEVIHQLNVKKLSVIPPFMNSLVPTAFPIILGKGQTPRDIPVTHLRSSGTVVSIGDDYFRNSGSTDVGGNDGAFEQRQLLQVDDILGCTWDFVTNSCKDLFSLKLCSHCHDFGNIFLHNCKCLAKYKTTF